MKIADMQNDELKKEYEGMCSMIDVSGCFGTKDLMWRDALEREIIKRGGQIQTTTEVEFKDEEEG